MKEIDQLFEPLYRIINYRLIVVLLVMFGNFATLFYNLLALKSDLKEIRAEATILMTESRR